MRASHPGLSQDSSSALATYFNEVQSYPLLTVEQERHFARIVAQGGAAAVDATHTLVTHNLRFVVKVALEYRGYGLKVADMIQEGNIGLMKAVQKFDVSKNIRLISYAVWWIRAFIQNYILKSWSLVKIGTTQAQRQLFFGLRRQARELKIDLGDPDAPALLAKKLGMREKDVEEVHNRMSGRDVSLDKPVNDDGGAMTFLDIQESNDRPDVDAEQKEASDAVREELKKAIARLRDSERLVIDGRYFQDPPLTLKELGEQLGCSRERVRQLEMRALGRLYVSLKGGPIRLIDSFGGGPSGRSANAIMAAIKQQTTTVRRKLSTARGSTCPRCTRDVRTGSLRRHSRYGKRAICGSCRDDLTLG